MPISRIEVDEYECTLCGYKWISRINGKDGPIPNRCAKCKRTQWEKGEIGEREKGYRDALKKKFGYWNSNYGPYQGGWRVEENIQRYLQRRPSIEEMKVILEPMCYLLSGNNFKKTRLFYNERYRSYMSRTTGWSERELEKKKRLVKSWMAKHAPGPLGYELQLSRQLLKDLMAERGIPYDEKEAKKTILYQRHGQYGPRLSRLVPELCDALKQDLPEMSNEDIKAKILKEDLREFKYVVKFFDELIESCWPEWINNNNEESKGKETVATTAAEA